MHRLAKWFPLLHQHCSLLTHPFPSHLWPIAWFCLGNTDINGEPILSMKKPKVKEAVTCLEPWSLFGAEFGQDVHFLAYRTGHFPSNEWGKGTYSFPDSVRYKVAAGPTPPPAPHSGAHLPKVPQFHLTQTYLPLDSKTHQNTYHVLPDYLFQLHNRQNCCWPWCWSEQSKRTHFTPGLQERK